MTFLAKARSYTLDEFSKMFNALDFAHASWKPRMMILHNTDAPSLHQWLTGTATPAERMVNLRHRYRDTLGWHSGPHWFVSPDLIWELCDPMADGVHCSCANKVAFGCEMIGDYHNEEFDSGDGAKVRDNAVHLIATVFNKMKWTPDPLILWRSGLGFHKNCVKDNHDCPGKKVDRIDLINRVNAKMLTLQTG